MASTENPRPSLLLIAMTAFYGVTEFLLLCADWGVFGSVRWRLTVMEHLGFWNGLLDNWRPNYRGQPVVMFVSYALLHSGLVHMIGNIAVLWWLGPRILAKLGTSRFVAVWLASILGGAVFFCTLSPSLSPMIGASGALFGVIGALVAIHYVDAQNMLRVVQITAGLVLLNLATFFLQGGVLAWETHLGGYVTGILMGALLYRPGPEADDSV